VQCTDCGKFIRPVVALDIDGTMGDYHSHFYEFACHWLGKSPPTPFYIDNLGLDLHTYRACKLAYRQGGMKRTMPMYYFADTLTAGLRKLGAEIWVTTTRPYNRLDNIDPDTQEWLRRHDIQYDYVIYDPDKYENLATQVDPGRVVAVLEDLPEQCDVARKLFGDGAVVQRYNGWVLETAPSNLEEHFYDIAARIGEWND